MIVTIYQQEKLVVEFLLQEHIPKIILEPQKMYQIRIYLEEKEEDVRLMPIERDNLVVLRFYSEELDSRSKPVNPKGAKRLLLYAHFKVDNDFAIPRVVRWAFRIKKEKIYTFDPNRDSFNKVLQTLQEDREFSYETLRIPLFVNPKRRSKLLVIISLVGAVAISEAYEFFRHANNSFTWPYFLRVVAILLCLFAALWALFGFYGKIVPYTYEDNIS